MVEEIKAKPRKRASQEELTKIVEDGMAKTGLAPGQVSPLRQEPPLDPLGVPEEEAEEEITVDIEEEARKIFGDLLVEEKADTRPTFQPGRRQMIKVDGGDYLNVRRRLMWLRGRPDERPLWAVKTQILDHDMGTWDGKAMRRMGRKSVPDVKGGYAVVQAIVCDENDRVIAEGMAHERSELFADFIEKAETAAIGRALAVAGYGTETALELDEGVADGNIVDSPVGGNAFAPQVEREPQPILIESSNIPGVRQGGRQSKATRAQLDRIRERARDLMLRPSSLAALVGAATGTDLGDIDDTPDGANLIMGSLVEMDFEQVGRVVQALDAAGPVESDHEDA